MVGFSLAFHVFPIWVPKRHSSAKLAASPGSWQKGKNPSPNNNDWHLPTPCAQLRILSYVYMTYTPIRQGKSCTHHHRLITLNKKCGRAWKGWRRKEMDSPCLRPEQKNILRVCCSCSKHCQEGLDRTSLPFGLQFKEVTRWTRLACRSP